MGFLGTLNIITGVIGLLLVINMILLIIAIKASLDWKITRAIIIVFLGLFIWSFLRIFNRLDEVNTYDYLIIIFNGGLLVTGYLTSKNIDR